VIPKKNRAKKKSGGEKKLLDSSAQFEKLLKISSVIQHYSLRLYITGTTPRSTQAVANIRSLCEEYLQGRYDLEVIDIYQQPTEAVDEQIIAAPTLVKSLPAPARRLIGDLSSRDRVIIGLVLRTNKARKTSKRPAV
jgi:circadian clock protein KaiB